MSRRAEVILRIMFDLALLLGVFIFPFWATAAIAVLGLIYFRSFFEFIIVFFLIDLIYGAPTKFFAGNTFALSIIALLLFVIVALVKRRMLVKR